MHLLGQPLFAKVDGIAVKYRTVRGVRLGGMGCWDLFWEKKEPRDDIITLWHHAILGTKALGN
jgi:hypothetical protein